MSENHKAHNNPNPAGHSILWHHLSVTNITRRASSSSLLSYSWAPEKAQGEKANSGNKAVDMSGSV